MAKKKNWDLIRNQEDKDTVKYRDVYEDQQLERGSIAEKETMTSRIVLAALASLLVGVLVWTIVSSVQMFTRKEGLDSNANPQDDYIHLGEFYYNPTDASDIISKEEYDIWYQQYHDYDGQRSSKDEPPDVPVDDTNEFAAKFSYDSETNTYSLKSSLYGQGETYSVAEYQQAVSDHYAEYQKKYDDYVLYYHRHTDPEYRKGDANSGIYAKAKSDLYREIGTTAVISKDAYDAKVQAYKKDMEDGKISEDVASIPLKPIDYSLIYSPYKFDYMSYAELWRLDSTDKLDVPDISGESEFMSFIKTCASKKINLLSNPYPDTMIAPDPDDTNAVKKYEAFQSFYKQLKELFPSYNFDTYGEYWDLFETYCTAAHFDREKKTYIHGTDMVKVILSYKSNYDGSVIERKEYKELINKYDQDYAEYKAAYLAHRKKYHPDNIDGSAAVFTMAPNLIKILISLIISGVVFGILYFVLKKNLTAQNIMSSTEDINQYHNDQHVALPEEVQKNYDWFPDVGAHSSVQVSSMISHMAISNKGLKQVTMAKRAKDDIKDKNGDIEYYKGEIILNDEGDPKTYQAPIVDTDFMEALFDASGASKDKDKRRYYDTTKIPYNPGNGNRDKLSGYDTVADLINNDWEFPLYEPQRPAGAYIVDTAPVNTMVLAITRAGKGQTVIE